MRAAARLHVADVLRIRDVSDVEDADAAQTILAHRLWNALRAAIDARREILARDEEKILVDRHVALRRGAVIRRPECRLGRIGDVPDLIAAEAALDDVVAGEGEVRVDPAGEALGWRGRRHEAQVPGGFPSIVEPRLQADARVGTRSGGRHGGRSGAGRGGGGGLSACASHHQRGGDWQHRRPTRWALDETYD